MSMKNPLTPAGIEPETFRFVAQHLNHCTTAVPLFNYTFQKVICVPMTRLELRVKQIFPLFFFYWNSDLEGSLVLWGRSGPRDLMLGRKI